MASPRMNGTLRDAGVEWSEATFRVALDAVPDAMFVIDRAGSVVIANAQSEQIFGYSHEQLIGRPVESLFPLRLRSQLLRQWESCFSDSRPRPVTGGMNLLAVRSDGSEFPVEMSFSPLATPAGSYVVGAIRDMTPPRQAEEEIRRLREQLIGKTSELASSRRELDDFTYSVAHDLRAPLRQVRGFSDMLFQQRSQALSPDSREGLEQIRAGARRMGELLDGLLSFSRLGRQPLVRQEVDLNAVVAGVIAELEQAGGAKNVRWEIGCLQPTECDSALIRQVIRHLLSNAVKFSRMRNPGVVEIGEAQRDEEPVFYVRDNGAGFDMKYADRLFGMFQRLHLEDEFEGTGVGLALVQRIIFKHGGRVWAHAEPNLGATFFFTLPGSGAGRAHS